MITIKKELIEEAEKLSTEWNNTGFVVKDKDGNLSATVWNHYKFLLEEESPPLVIAHVCKEGWKIKEEYKNQYKLEEKEVTKKNPLE